jgi:hypothetical protein
MGILHDSNLEEELREPASLRFVRICLRFDRGHLRGCVGDRDVENRLELAYSDAKDYPQ